MQATPNEPQRLFYIFIHLNECGYVITMFKGVEGMNLGVNGGEWEVNQKGEKEE